MNFFRHEKATRLRSSNLKEAAVLARDSSGKDDLASGRCDRCFCIWGRVGSDIDGVCMCIWAFVFMVCTAKSRRVTRVWRRSDV